MCGFMRRTSLYSSSTLMWRWLARNALTMVSRWAVDFRRCARRCSLKRAKRSSAVCFASVIAQGIPRRDAFEQRTRGRRQIDVVEGAAGELVDQHIEMDAHRQTALEKDDLVVAQTAAAAAHAIADLAQQALLAHLQSQLLRRRLQLLEQRLLGRRLPCRLGRHRQRT